MSDESTPEKEPAAKKGQQSNVASAFKVIENSETVSGSIRQLVDAGLLGVCIVFLATMLTMTQKQIAPLTVALVAFVVAIPLLVCGFIFASYRVKPVPGLLVLKALIITAWIAEGFGELAVAVGVSAVIFHLSLLAFNAFIASIILASVGVFVLAFVGLFIYAIRQSRLEKQPPAPSQSADPKSSSIDHSTATTDKNPTMMELPPQTSGS